MEIGPYDQALRRHREWMSTEAAKEAYKLRKQLVEPVFGIIKEQQGARRFLLRGLANVAAEWSCWPRPSIYEPCGGPGGPAPMSVGTPSEHHRHSP